MQPLFCYSLLVARVAPEKMNPNILPHLHFGDKQSEFVMNKQDLTGFRSGRLVVVCESGRTKNGCVRWLCKCDCGNTCLVSSDHLKRGKVRSCGCLNSELASNRCKRGELQTKLGMSKTFPKLCKSLSTHWSKRGAGCYENLLTGDEYLNRDGSLNVQKLAYDIVQRNPSEWEAYEKEDYVLDIDLLSKGVGEEGQKWLIPETVRCVSQTDNLNCRKCSLKIDDTTSFASFCHMSGVTLKREYSKYATYFVRHNGEGHPELIKKATDYIKLLRELKAKLEWLAAIREFKETWKDLLMNISQKTLNGFTKKQGTLSVKQSSRLELKSSPF